MGRHNLQKARKVMGQVITRKAGTDRILAVFAKTFTQAAARGGDVQSIAVARLGGLQADVAEVEQQYNDARDVDEKANVALMARDAESDLEIGAVIDEIWNCTGRPAQSVDYELIVGGGRNDWTEGNPSRQPHLMNVLSANIRHTSHPKLQAKKEDWALRIDAKATAQAEAAKSADASEILVTTLSMRRRTLAFAAQVALTRLKRDFKNAGMTEAQVHEIIPDVPATLAGTAAGNAVPESPPNGAWAASSSTAQISHNETTASGS
jgi:hypothetical protein